MHCAPQVSLVMAILWPKIRMGTQLSVFRTQKRTHTLVQTQVLSQHRYKTVMCQRLCGNTYALTDPSGGTGHSGWSSINPSCEITTDESWSGGNNRCWLDDRYMPRDSLQDSHGIDE